MNSTLSLKQPLLFHAYPRLAGGVPWIPLVEAPTPVQRMENLERELGAPGLWVKRDDLTAVPYGGNKPRKLEFVIADAKAKGARAVMTFGGIGTNHGLATTIYAAANGLRSLLVLFPQPVTEHVRRNLLLNARFGAEMRLGGTYPGVACRALAWLAAERAAGRRVYVLPPGGSSVRGALGYVNAALEIAAQVRDGALPAPDFAFVPAGTCGTAAGLLAGFHIAGMKTVVVGVRVAARIAVNRGVAARLCDGIFRFLAANGADPTTGGGRAARPCAALMKNLVLIHDFHGRGYGYPTPAGLEAIEKLEALEGLRLEPTYTGKAMAAMIDFVKRNRAEKRNVLFVNTYNSRSMNGYLEGVRPDALPQALRRYFIPDDNCSAG
ncbi:MAG: pyridoxal-phosphate dependent enzyme [bacterium]